MAPDRVQVPLRTGLWAESADGEVRLLGSRCPRCTEVVFPARPGGVCPHCRHRGMQGVPLGPDGILYSFTTVMQRPPGYYRGPVPYTLAWVELPQAVRVESLLVGIGDRELAVGMPVALRIGTLHTDDAGRDVLTYLFAPRP